MIYLKMCSENRNLAWNVNFHYTAYESICRWLAFVYALGKNSVDLPAHIAEQLHRFCPLVIEMET